MYVYALGSGLPQLCNATKMAGSGHLHSVLELGDQNYLISPPFTDPLHHRDTRMWHITYMYNFLHSVAIDSRRQIEKSSHCVRVRAAQTERDTEI